MTHIFLVTGATGAIGKAIAKKLAWEQSHEVVIAARNEEKASKTVEEIRSVTGNEKIRIELVDVSRKQSIFSLAERWSGPLHGLINNAGTTPRNREKTPDGIEVQFATNVLGYFWMIRAFEPMLIRSAPARVINVASYWAGDLDLDDLEFERRRYSNGRAYRQSKQANRMLTAAFARRLEPHNVTVNACHPGDVNSKLSNNLGFGGHESPEKGADTPVWLATAPEVQGVTGAYFEDRTARNDPLVQDKQAVEQLFQACLAYS